MNTNIVALKPCPFCAGKAIIKEKATVMVQCTTCTATIFQSLENRKYAIRKWNTRK